MVVFASGIVDERPTCLVGRPQYCSAVPGSLGGWVWNLAGRWGGEVFGTLLSPEASAVRAGPLGPRGPAAPCVGGGGCGGCVVCELDSGREHLAAASSGAVSSLGRRRLGVVLLCEAIDRQPFCRGLSIV